MSSNKQKEAHQFMEQHGKAVQKMPGGNDFMGIKSEGPKKDGIFAEAQAHEGNISKDGKLANIEKNAMKK